MKPKILIPMVTLACLLAAPATAQVNYAISGGSAYVTNSPNASGDIVIASTYQGKPVTSIGSTAFRYCTSLTGVTIPTSVTSIGAGSFSSCPFLFSDFFWWRFNVWGELAAVVLGLPISIFVWFVLDFQDSAKYPMWQGLALLFGLSLVVLTMVTLLTPPERMETLTGFDLTSMSGHIKSRVLPLV